jgi:hypothetical protein
MVVPCSHSQPQTDIPGIALVTSARDPHRSSSNSSTRAAKTKTNKELKKRTQWYRLLIHWYPVAAFHEGGMQLLQIQSRRRSVRRLHESGCRTALLHNKADRTATVSTVACSANTSRIASTICWLFLCRKVKSLSQQQPHSPFIPHNIS